MNANTLSYAALLNLFFSSKKDKSFNTRPGGNNKRPPDQGIFFALKNTLKKKLVEFPFRFRHLKKNQKKKRFRIRIQNSTIKYVEKKKLSNFHSDFDKELLS